MQFVYPPFLWALLALAIPIILHLFYFRRFKKVYFTNVHFLKEVKEESSARSKLRNLLVLAARLLALLFLVLGFAQPFLPQDVDVKKGEKAISLFVDNSFSMSALSQDVPLLQKAKQRAKEIVEAYAPDDRFQILTNDFEGRHQRLVSKEDALGLIDEIKISPASHELSKVLTRQRQVLTTTKAPNQIAYLISDFQKNITDLKSLKDTVTEVSLVPLTAVQEKNISIDSAWFDVPVQMLNQVSPLVVKVRNWTNESADNVRLSLRHDGQEKPVGTLSIPAGGTVEDTVNITIRHTGWHEAELSITDYPVQFDDKYYFTFDVAKQINVLIINDNTQNRYLNSAFSGINYFNVTNQSNNNLDYSKFPSYQLIVLNEPNVLTSGLVSELAQFVRNGGNLLFFPSANAKMDNYNSFFTTFQASNFIGFDTQERNIATVNTEEFIFNDVFLNKSANFKLPTTKGNFRMNGKRGEDLLTYRDGNTFVAKIRMDKGNFYLCTAPLSEQYNDLAKNGEIFVPMLYKMAISTARENRIAYTIGKDDYLEAEQKTATAAGETAYRLKGLAEEFIPEQKVLGSKVILGVGENIKEAGIYKLYTSAKDTLQEYAFNYDRKESRLDYFNKNDLEQFASKNLKIIDATAQANFTQLIGERSQGVSLWRWCLIAALAFLMIEQLLLRFWKV